MACKHEYIEYGRSKFASVCWKCKKLIPDYAEITRALELITDIIKQTTKGE